MAGKASRNAQVREVRATFDTREADKWCEQLEKRYPKRQGHEIARRRETFSFGVIYVVTAVRRAQRAPAKPRKAITKVKRQAKRSSKPQAVPAQAVSNA